MIHPFPGKTKEPAQENGFTFRPRKMPLLIAGHAFSVDAGAKFSETLKRLADECDREIQESGGGERKPCDFLLYLIDELLGEGASETIFGDGVPDLYDAADIVIYICDSFSAFQKERLFRYRKMIGKESNE